MVILLPRSIFVQSPSSLSSLSRHPYCQLLTLSSFLAGRPPYSLVNSLLGTYFIPVLSATHSGRQILALLVQIAFLLRHVGVGVLPPEFLAMLASNIGVVIVIAIVSTVTTLSIEAVSFLATAFPSTSSAAVRPPAVSWRW